MPAYWPAAGAKATVASDGLLKQSSSEDGCPLWGLEPPVGSDSLAPVVDPLLTVNPPDSSPQSRRSTRDTGAPRIARCLKDPIDAVSRWADPGMPGEDGPRGADDHRRPVRHRAAARRPASRRRRWPALNPNEMANVDLKQAVTKLAAARTKLQLVKAVARHLRSVQRQPERSVATSSMNRCAVPHEFTCFMPAQ